MAIDTLHITIWLPPQDCEENNKQIGHELGVSYRHVLKVLMPSMKRILLQINAHQVWFLSRHWSLILASSKFKLKLSFKSWSQSRSLKYICWSPVVVWMWNVLAADPDWEGCGLSLEEVGPWGQVFLPGLTPSSSLLLDGWCTVVIWPPAPSLPFLPEARSFLLGQNNLYQLQARANPLSPMLL